VGDAISYVMRISEEVRLIVSSIFLLIHRILKIPMEIIKVDHATCKRGEEMIRKEIEAQWETKDVT
jgi:hypothetical protein